MSRGEATKQAMVEGARQLIKLNGFNATSFGDVLEMTSTPRGSTYFHFPEGKEQLGEEVLVSARESIVAIVHAADAQTRNPRTFVRRFAKLLADRLEDSDYSEGCPIAAIALEKSHTSPRLRAASSKTFEAWADAVQAALEAKGLSARDAAGFAMTVVSTVEGAILVGKARRSRRELEAAGKLLAAGVPARTSLVRAA